MIVFNIWSKYLFVFRVNRILDFCYKSIELIGNQKYHPPYLKWFRTIALSCLWCPIFLANKSTCPQFMVKPLDWNTTLKLMVQTTKIELNTTP